MRHLHFLESTNRSPRVKVSAFLVKSMLFNTSRFAYYGKDIPKDLFSSGRNSFGNKNDRTVNIHACGAARFV